MQWILLTQNIHLLSVYEQACDFTSSDHIRSPNILSKDRAKRVS